MCETIGARIRRIRDQRGLTQENLSEIADVNRVTLAKYETDKVKPGSVVLTRLAHALGVSTDYLLGREEPAAPTLDEQLSDIDFALSGEIRDLTDDEKQDILDYVRFKRSQKKAR